MDQSDNDDHNEILNNQLDSNQKDFSNKRTRTSPITRVSSTESIKRSDKVIHVRIAPALKERLNAAAYSIGMDLSTFLRVAALEKVKRENL